MYEPQHFETAFGWNQYGQFGNGRQNAYARLFKTKLRNPWRVQQIACGQTHSLFLTSLGHVYCAGMNQMGQCGIQVVDYSRTCILQMIPVPGLLDIVSIACGQSHSLCVDRRGKVFCFGSNADGQLGFVNESLDHMSYQTPTAQQMLQEHKAHIGLVRAGIKHSLFVDTVANRAYLCGDNIHGQVGNNKKDVSQVYLPYCFPGSIVDGACGARHTVLLSEQRNVLMAFGSNTNHQCSAQVAAEYMFEPHTLTPAEIGLQSAKETICSVICGYDTTIVTTRGF